MLVLAVVTLSVRGSRFFFSFPEFQLLVVAKRVVLEFAPPHWNQATLLATNASRTPVFR